MHHRIHNIVIDYYGVKKHHSQTYDPRRECVGRILEIKKSGNRDKLEHKRARKTVAGEEGGGGG